MITNEAEQRIRAWFTGRIPEGWQSRPVEVTVDREEVIVRLTLEDVGVPDGAGDWGASELDEARAGRTRAFREDTREARMAVAREAEHRFDRKVSWSVTVGDRTELFTHIAAPVMTRLRQPQRQVLDTLVDAGVARSRSEALAWCVRLVGQHEDDWLSELRTAMGAVADARAKGPAA
ncbi:MAG TPA: hypothetical protein VER39_05275 [Nocardioidaceae bacterium]|nr:hypothetical protein [Nocardioidaceae bacterium]